MTLLLTYNNGTSLKKNQEIDNIRLKMIQDLIVFINDLRSPKHQVILLIDANEVLSLASVVYQNLRNKQTLQTQCLIITVAT